MRAGGAASTGFIQDYAAKRAAQMERARALREMRESKAPPPPPPPGAPSGSAQRLGLATPPLQQPQHDAYSYSDDYPPPLPRTGSSGRAAAEAAMGAGGGGGGATAVVTEDDFYRAVGQGIITKDQARQLWAVVSSSSSSSPSSSSGIGVRPPQHVEASQVRTSLDRFGSQQQAVSHHRVSASSQLDEIPARAGGGGGGGGGGGPISNYDPSDYTPPSASAQGWTQNPPPQQQPDSAKRGAGRTPAGAATRKSGRPEWNGNWAVEEEQQQQQQQQQQEEQREVQRQERSDGAARRAKLPQRPRWNEDFAEEQQPQPHPQDAPSGTRGAREAAANPFARARGGTAARGSGRGGGGAFDAGDWNSEFTSGAGISGAPPPLPGRAGHQQRRSAQRTDDDDGGGSSQSSAVPPPRRAAAAASTASGHGLAAQRGQRRAGGGRADPEPPAEVEPDPDELAEFERLKAQQREEFERALQQGADNERLVPCSLCGRTFRESIVGRHMNACRKVSKKRKEFNMKEQRLDGIDGIEQVKRAPPSRAARGKLAGGGRQDATATVESAMPANKMPKWKIQHQQFQAALAAIKHTNAAGPGGAPPPPMPQELDDRVPCPYCGRKYAKDVADRHIPKCKNIIAKPKSLAGVAGGAAGGIGMRRR